MDFYDHEIKYNRIQRHVLRKTHQLLSNLFTFQVLLHISIFAHNIIAPVIDLIVAKSEWGYNGQGRGKFAPQRATDDHS
jgi:hypothetical protein